MIAHIKEGLVISYKRPSAGTTPVPVFTEGKEFNSLTENILGPEVIVESDKVRFVYTKVPREDAVESLQTSLLNEVRELFESKSNSITNSYPASEINTWDQQKSEAKAYTLDNGAPIPILSRIASGRGITIEVLVARVIVKTNAYLALLGDLLGRKQALEDLIEADNMILLELFRIERDELHSGWL